MSKWNKDKLEEMTNTQNEFTKTKLNYLIISQKYFEMINKARENGDLIPLLFKDVEVTYDGKISEDFEEIQVNDEILALIEEKENKRQVMNIKHFSRSISHQQWFDYLDDEVNNFIEKYPEFKDTILE